MMDDLLRGNDQINDHVRASDGVDDDTVVQESTAAPAPGQATAPLVVNRPASGQTVTLDPAAGQTIVLNFDPAAAQVRIEGDDLVLAFDDNGDGVPDSRLVFLGLASPDAESATFQIGGSEINAALLVAQTVELAGQNDAPLDEVAAGPGATGGGGSTYSDNLGDILDLLVAQGVIPPVQLEFRLIELENEIFIPAEDVPAPDAPLVVLIHDETRGPGLPGARPVHAREPAGHGPAALRPRRVRGAQCHRRRQRQRPRHRRHR